MVSLINFKIVNEELQGQQEQQQPQHRFQQQQQRNPNSNNNNRGQLLVRVVSQHQHQQQHHHQQRHQHVQQPQEPRTMQARATSGETGSPLQLTSSSRSTTTTSPMTTTTTMSLEPTKQQAMMNVFASEPSGKGDPHQQQQQHLACEAPNFVVTWRNLKFAIEPKWHQKMRASGGRLASQVHHQQQASIESGRPQGGARQSGSTATKVVLDRLDGSFRSGELTAILGPSGAGKTTLLDCLTGRRKNGLSGSIRISSSSSSSKCHHQQPAELHVKASYGPSMVGTSGGGDHLKVSIIPQNDHLMGHLTVYETLNYASKMKNCFEPHFDHKLNISRVAQQLGLMSCLATRINKLSGGQYKRVSIAQELLSSPDILILDEPTSGLDAMTCYQTVQVLRQLTDLRRASGQNQIAVILTIHQPNSDVFQQFNHVYVVAQGGKCIYEGPPQQIESVINRVGIRLPSSYYNPATMIVEIAAGKFGLEAVQKLNGIQKKQYELQGPLSDIEQNSTGDSAVDFPSSHESSGSDYSDADCSRSASSATSADDAELANQQAKSAAATAATRDEINNNLGQLQQKAPSGGLLNKGFVMENEEEGDADEIKRTTASCPTTTALVMSPLMDADQTDKPPTIAKTKIALGEENSEQQQRQRKKRPRTRRRPVGNELQPVGPTSDFGGLSGSGGSGGSGGSSGGGGENPREKRLKLNSLKADQKFPFWRHTYLHFHRSWLSIVRDPLLCGMQLALHIIVPVMVSLVYGTNVGKPNACPRAGPMDIMAYALEPTDTALQLQQDFRTTLENIGYIFFKLYGIIFAAMTVTVLTFPLDMHVLVKEFRNGWYGLSSYFLGRTLADIPFQLTLPLLAMSLSYYATGQPYSYLQWRFLSITGILILSSLIAQSQGLLFGAILMDKMKAAVFVAPAATTPIILFAGFLVRTQSIPRYLRPLSSLSYLRYAIEACLISRYGFNQCECDPAIFNQTVPELPPIARSMLDYWLSSFRQQQQQDQVGAANLTELSADLAATTTPLPSGQNPDLFSKLIDSLAKANSFGRNITSCEQVVPYPMIDYDLKDSQLFNCFAILLFMLIATRLLTFFIVCFKVKRKV